MREIDRWRVCLSRHIKALVNFSSQRSCDRRIQKLAEMGYISKKKFLYGVPSLYFLTKKGKLLIGVSNYKNSIKIEQIVHDIIVLDTAIYFHTNKKILFSHMKTEKELHSLDGFSNRKHRPDFVFIDNQNQKTNCVEIELSAKAKNRLEKNIQDNFMNYEKQFWIVPKQQKKILKILKESSQIYANINMILAEDVSKIVK